MRAVDYVLKPVRADRLAEAVRRVVEGGDVASDGQDLEVPVERGGVTRIGSGVPTSPTSRRRATTPGCTPRTGRTCCGSR